MTAAEMITALNLAPHPEGGWYRETWRAAPGAQGGRGAATSILFLLEDGHSSHWHRVDAAELWIAQRAEPGARLTLSTWAQGDAAVVERRIGVDLAASETPQAVVEPQAWQAARAQGGWALAACVVAPAFSFEGFQMAAPDWSPPVALPPAEAQNRRR